MREEDNLQKLCVKWFYLQYPTLVLMAFPAGFVFSGDSTKRASTGALMKAMGYRNGTPDLFIPKASNGFAGLFIEMKTSKGQVQPSQKELQAYLSGDYKCAICRSFEEFQKVVNEYLKS